MATRIRGGGVDVIPATVSEVDLSTSVAGGGLTGGAGTPLAVNLATAGGLQVVADELGIKLNGGTLALAAGGISVVSSPAAAITDDTTTNATMFPVWVTASTGNLPLKVSSTKLSFNPSTGTFTVTGAALGLVGAAGTDVLFVHNSTAGGTVFLAKADASVTINGLNSDPTVTGLTINMAAGGAWVPLVVTSSGGSAGDTFIISAARKVGIGIIVPTAKLHTVDSSSPTVDTTLIAGSATWNAGTLVTTRTLVNLEGVTTPTVTVTEGGADGNLTMYGMSQAIPLGGLTMGDNPSGQPQALIIGNNIAITGDPIFNDTVGTGTGDTLTVYGTNSSIISAPVATSLSGNERVSYIGGNFQAVVTQATLGAAVYGFFGSAAGNLPNGTHVGALLQASGTAIQNTGLAVAVTGATANVGILISTTAAGANNYALDSTAAAKVRLAGDFLLLSKTVTYNSIATTGWGIPAIYGTGRSSAQTAAVASVAAYTVGAADGSFLVSCNVNVTTSTLHSFSVQVDYTDETNTARTSTLTVTQLAGTPIVTITNGTGVGPYEGIQREIRCKASTTITVKTTGTFTAVTYNVEGSITQIA